MSAWSFFLAILGVYVLGSLTTYILYAWDKRAARRGLSRIPEKRLHLFELLCGWPGALIAQHHLHHKWRKSSYMWKFWLIVAGHVALWGGVLFLIARR